jgi:hypothetical protein
MEIQLDCTNDKISIISDLRFFSEYEILQDWDIYTHHKVIVIEITNSFATEGKYELDKIPHDYSIEFNGFIEKELDSILKEIL